MKQQDNQQSKKVRKSTQPKAKKESRPPIKPEEALRLWVSSGGRCAFCNKELLINSHFMYELKVGEMAHVVGWSTTSPRGNVSLALDARNDADNLLLLCEEDHKLIDNNKYVPEFTVEKLLARKRAHEARIKHLTSLTEDRETVVLRMLGGIRGAAVELSQQHAAQAIINYAERFPRFPLAYDRHGVEVDLTSLPEPEEDWSTYWHTGKRIIDKCVSKIKEGMEEKAVRHLSVFAFTRIPFLVYLGFHLDDKIATDIYQKQRGDSETWIWAKEQDAAQFEVVTLRTAPPQNIALILSVSGSISQDLLPPEINADFNLFELKPVNIAPNRDILKSKVTLDNFTACYHNFLSQLEITHKQAPAIHLFMATPLSAAIACGRGIMREVHPALHIYDRTTGKYQLALSINAPV